MRKAWVEDGMIRDVCPGDPQELYHPEVARLYTEDVPDDAQNGDLWDGQTLTKSEPVRPAVNEATTRKVSPVEFKLLFTPHERLAIKAARASDEVIDDWMEIIEDPRLTQVDLTLQSTQDGIAYLVSKGILTEDRAAEILAGKVI